MDIGVMRTNVLIKLVIEPVSNNTELKLIVEQFEVLTNS